MKVNNKSELRKIIKERYKESLYNNTYTIDVGDLDVSNVEYMYDMFRFCHELKEIKGLENWDVSSVEDMSYMFADCDNLEYLDLSNWGVSNVKDMNGLFAGCKKLKDIKELSNWDVSNVEDMAFMFCDCKNLKDISSLTTWDVSNVENMNGMFKATKFEDVNLVELKTNYENKNEEVKPTKKMKM